jgi:hypothetical protein
MNQSQHVMITLIAVIFCACLAASLPASLSSGDSGDAGEAANEDFRHLMALLRRMKEKNSALADSWGVVGEGGKQEGATGKLAQALKQSYGGLNKRNWSYDYGMGGGRFGKRYYGDYGIGGGRFGRDVDHVDISDTNDVTL